MKENKYDDPTFFGKYSRMPRSKEGLAAAGEWHVLRRMLPPFEGKRVLDLGCGFGWHCRYAVEQGAASVVGVDLSERMLAEARAMTDSPAIQYLRMPIEAIDFPADSFDVAISSLAFHYIESFGGLCAKVNRCLSPPEGASSFPWSIRYSPRRDRRNGIATRRGIISTGPWTAIFPRASARPVSSAKRS